MLLSVSPAATTWTTGGGTSALRGAPTGAAEGTVGPVAASRVCGGVAAAVDGRRRGITRCWPGRTIAGLVMLLASMTAETGTPWRCAIISSVSPGATVTGVPPSQVQTGGGGGAGIEPVTSPL